MLNDSINIECPALSNNGEICILMCTFQGEKHLADQLESIRKQTYKNWRLFVSDDGSTDTTLEILRNFQASLVPGQMEIFNGPRRGFADNFMSLLLNPKIEGSYFAFSDQDDYWLENKLSEAVLKLKALPHRGSRPAMYASSRVQVNEDLKPIGIAGKRRLVPSFNNALVQNIAGGNTILLNKSLRDILLKIGAVEVVAHDWWTYLVCTGVGGDFCYDNEAYLLYRQHSNNVIGSGCSWGTRRKRLDNIFNGRYRQRIDINLKALELAKWTLAEDNVGKMERFLSLRDKPAPIRIIALLQSGIHRQSWFGNLGLLFASLLNKI